MPITTAWQNLIGDKCGAVRMRVRYTAPVTVVGIDLGTTNTVVAAMRGNQLHVLADEQGQRLLPSVVSFHPNGEVLVGHAAKARRLVDARNTVGSIKRLLGANFASSEVGEARARFSFIMKEGPGGSTLVHARGQDFTLSEISAFVLKRARQIADYALGEVVTQAVITVPAHFNELQRASTKVAARVAGLEVLRVMSEPTAAALAYGLGRGSNERIAVYDFGGGTFDCTILALAGDVFEVLGAAGDSFLGGDDFDAAIGQVLAERVLRERRFDPRSDPQIMERLRDAAERLKMLLSTNAMAHLRIEELYYEPGGKPAHFDFTLSQGEFEHIAAKYIDRTFAVAQDTLQTARISASGIDRVVLVGGSSRIPLVRRRVAAFFGHEPYANLNPEEVVAIGAAIQANALATTTAARPLPAPPPLLSRALPPKSDIGSPETLLRSPAYVGGAIDSALSFDDPATLAAGTLAMRRMPAADEQTHNALQIDTLKNGASSQRPAARSVIPADGRAFGDIEEPASLPPRMAPARIPLFPSSEMPFGGFGPNATARPNTPTTLASEPNRHVQHAPISSEHASPLSVTQVPRTVPEQFAPMRSVVPPGRFGVVEEPSSRHNDRRVEPPLPVQNAPDRGAPGRTGPLPPRTPPPGASKMSATTSMPPRPLLTPPPLPPVEARIDRGADGTAPFTPLGPARIPGPPGVNSTLALPQMGAQLAARAVQGPMPAHAPQTQQLLPSPGPAAAKTSLGQPYAPNPPQAPFYPAPPPLPIQSGYAASAPFVSSPPPAPFAPQGLVQPAPILVDVTPRALVVETSGGFTDILIARNAKVPCERTRMFATARDGQTQVRIRVAQGEASKFADNTFLGELELSGIRPTRRGDVTLEVSFELDEDGTLRVRARDRETRIEAQAVMQLTQGLDELSIVQMVGRIGQIPVSDRNGSSFPLQGQPPPMALGPGAPMQSGHAQPPFGAPFGPPFGLVPGAAPVGAPGYAPQGPQGGRGSIVPLGPAGSSIPKPRVR